MKFYQIEQPGLFPVPIILKNKKGTPMTSIVIGSLREKKDFIFATGRGQEVLVHKINTTSDITITHSNRNEDSRCLVIIFHPIDLLDINNKVDVILSSKILLGDSQFEERYFMILNKMATFRLSSTHYYLWNGMKLEMETNEKKKARLDLQYTVKLAKDIW